MNSLKMVHLGKQQDVGRLGKATNQLLSFCVRQYERQFGYRYKAYTQ